MTYTIEKVTTLIGARRYGDNDTNIGFILTDSRSLCFPEETLFLRSSRSVMMVITTSLSCIAEV